MLDTDRCKVMKKRYRRRALVHDGDRAYVYTLAHSTPKMLALEKPPSSSTAFEKALTFAPSFCNKFQLVYLNDPCSTLGVTDIMEIIFYYII
jgi:hypothetical protein